MSSRKFKFISPGIFINEIDRSHLPALPADVGPALIGRFERGPALKPVQINSFEEFVETFGNPIPGGKSGDVFRNGNYTAPTYAAYAAQAWLRNNSPVTIVRLLGDTNKDAIASGYAGWQTENTAVSTTTSSQGGAFGLWIAQHDPMTLTIEVNMSASNVPALIDHYTMSFTGSHTVTLTASHLGGTQATTGSSNSTATPIYIGIDGGFGTGSGNNTTTAANIATAINLSADTSTSATSTGNIVTVTFIGTDAHIMSVASPGTHGNDGGGGQRDGSNPLAITSSNSAIHFESSMLAGADSSNFVFASSSLTPPTGTLAAIWYLDKGTMELSGNTIDSASIPVTGAGIWVRPVEAGTFKAIISDGTDTVIAQTSFNFSETSERYIRKRFNTNPTLTNDDINSSAATYWLGETFEGCAKEKVLNVSSATNRLYGAIIPLTSPDGTTTIGGNFRKSSSTISAGSNVLAKTGWFISQDTGTDYEGYAPDNMTKLFRLVGRLTREEVQRKIKISIKDIKKSSDPNSDFGSFTVAIRDIKDTDDKPVYLEQYNNCNLNRASDNYIGKKIGDKFEEWDYDGKLYKEYGDYSNISRYIRVQVADDVGEGKIDATLLPFGVFGPPAFNSWALTSVSRPGNATLTNVANPLEAWTTTTGTLVYSGINYAGSFDNANGVGGDGGAAICVSTTGSISASFDFPRLRLRVSSSEGFVQDPTDAFFGVDTTYNQNRFDFSTLDVLRAKPAEINSHEADTSNTTASFVFSLDNIRNVNATAMSYTGTLAVNAVYDDEARKNKVSYTSLSGASGGDSSPAYDTVLEAGFNRFTTCLHGGWDGLDITEREPFRNTGLATGGETGNYAYNSISVAIDSLRDPERVQYNLLSMPGLTNNTLNSKIVRVAEARGDALAVIDLAGGFTPDTEGTDSIQDRLGTVNAVVATVSQDLRLNSSYGACYYPWVQIRDTVNGASIWAPPSVAAIGAFSYSEAVSELWFAPAGFTRGGLSANNAAGLPVVGVRQRLTSKERDKLYENNINPIASFPAEGIVIFGQKTLQTTPSALDRINVRRLAIFLKREISRISATLLFDQNVQITWNRFKGQVETLLGGVKAGLGLTDYKVILDETTTTPDLIDRNILYAKIFVKPARAIEFIAIDFIITDSGASFDD